jgi:hypothetical protein
MKSFPQILKVRNLALLSNLLYNKILIQVLYNKDCISDQAIIYWHQKGSKPQGRQHFLKATEPLVKVRETVLTDVLCWQMIDVGNSSCKNKKRAKKRSRLWPTNHFDLLVTPRPLGFSLCFRFLRQYINVYRVNIDDYRVVCFAFLVRHSIDCGLSHL